MDILPNLLGEAEFRFFTEQDYLALSDILDDSLALWIKRYVENPDADAKVVEDIREHMWSLVESLTFHFKLQEMGMVELIRGLSPENIVQSGIDEESVIKKLKFLEDNIGKLRTVISPRTKTMYENFIASIKGVLSRMSLEGATPTYPDIIKRIESNKFVFYVPNDKGHNTGMNLINSRKKAWTMCLRGLEYKQYCDNAGINYIVRRLF